MFINSFSIEKPHLLLLILLIIPAILFVYYKFKRISFLLSLSKNQKNRSFVKSLKSSIFWKTFFRCLSWIFAILALCEISWGTKKTPVHKSGSNVYFVFDISYSMLANDASPKNEEKKLTRLEASQIYAKELINKLPSSSYSAVLAKGDGFVAVPETEDESLIIDIIENLSPRLMTSAGSSLGKGIEAALNEIPRHSSKSQYIFIFTDGDETDNHLEKALEKAVKFGVPVSIIGFGNEEESEILAGDGKTKVKTALRSQKIKEIISSINSYRSEKETFSKNSQIQYLNSKEKGSAWKIISQIKNNHSNDENLLVYEINSVNHHKLFIFMAIFMLLMSFLTSEFSFSNIKKKKEVLLTGIVLFSTIFTSCSNEKKQILDGVFKWYEGKYTGATAAFLNTTNSAKDNSIEKNYAIFNLSVTYLSMGENEAALERLSQINLDDKNLPPELRTAGFYNQGIIYQLKGDYVTAAENFKKAILANPANLNAKINLELCERELFQNQSKNGNAEMQGVNEEKADNKILESEIFTLIREKEGKKWKNMGDGGEKDESIIDF